MLRAVLDCSPDDPVQIAPRPSGVAVPHVGLLTAYCADLRAPEHAPEGVRDRDLTTEHWITGDVLTKHGNSIALRALGFAPSI